MENNYSTLNALEGLIKIHKKKSLALLQSKATKNITASHCDIVLQMIEGLKDVEIEQSRLDWKAGYIDCCLDCAEFFGNKRDKSYPTESEMETIEKLSHDFIKNRKIN
jgi:hypothetical protein